MDFPGLPDVVQPGAVGVRVVAPDAGATGIRQLDLAGDLEAPAAQLCREPDGLLKSVEESAPGGAHGAVVTAI